MEGVDRGCGGDRGYRASCRAAVVPWLLGTSIAWPLARWFAGGSGSCSGSGSGRRGRTGGAPCTLATRGTRSGSGSEFRFRYR
jgi:hypothetical protein